MTTSPIGRVLARLECVKKAGAGYEARCPGHEDRDPSLSVKEADDDGRVLLHCHAGCPVEVILAAIKLQASDLFAGPATNGHRSDDDIIATYPYTDEAGNLLFEVVRKAGKRFVQRHHDPDDPKADREGWVWNTRGMRRVLYRLVDVVEAAAAGVEVWICEGEKDVAAIDAAGEVATCCPGGAGKWRSEYAEFFTGADVIIVADQDPPGIKHAADVEASLLPVTRSVRVVRPAVGKDAYDHLSAGYGMADFVEEGQEAVGETPEGDPDDAAIVEWGSFWADDKGGGEWLVEPILPAGRQVAMFASAKAGKSLLALEVAAAVATGRAVLDQPAGPPMVVVYLDWEQSADDLRERLVDLGYGPDDDLSNLRYYLLPNLPSLDTKGGGEAVAGILDRWKPALVVIDTMARAVVGDENESDTLRAFYRHTGTRIKVAGVTLWRLDHAGKDPAKGQRGTSAKTEDVDVVFRLTADGNRVELRRTHSRVPWVPERVVLNRREEPLEHRTVGADSWTPGTAQVADDLDELGVPLDATVKAAALVLKAADRGRRRVVVVDALRFRRTRP